MQGVAANMLGDKKVTVVFVLGNLFSKHYLYLNNKLSSVPDQEFIQVVLEVERVHSVPTLSNTSDSPILVLEIFCVRSLNLALRMGIFLSSH